MKLESEFIRLPFKFDVARLTAEVAQFAESDWMAHPNNFQGNAAIPLVSLQGQNNNAFHGPMKTTPHLARCEYIQQIMTNFGEVFGRSRLMRLTGGSEVQSHADIDYHWHNRVRIHIPIITYPEVIFYCGEKAVHMQAGECWIFNSWLMHRVVNPTNYERVHLVLDTTGSSRFWNWVEQSVWPFKPHNKALKEEQLMAYQPGSPTRVLTENFNAAPIMSPGELEALVEAIIGDYESNPKNDPQVAGEFTKILRSFYKDWRCLWMLHGFTEQGIPHYQNLIKQVDDSATRLPDQLVCSSHGIDSRTILFAQVLSTACCANLLPHFMGSASVRKRA